MQAYRTSQPPPYAVEYELQTGTAQNQTYAPFALLTHQCIPVCCPPNVTTATHMPVNAWGFPAPCSAHPGVQLIPCCDGSQCTLHHATMSTAPRHFRNRPSATQLGISPYHCPQFHTHRLPPPPPLAAVPVPLASSVYQPPHLQSNSVAPQSIYPQHPAQTQQPVYHNHQMPASTQHLYHQPHLVPRGHQSSEELVPDAGLTNIQFPNVSSQVYQQPQQQQQQQSVHHTAVGGQPLLLQPVASDFITGTFSHYRPVTSSRQRWRSYQPMATPYSGYLLHFLAMLGRPTAVVGTALQHRTGLQQEDFTDLDSYEALLSLAERLGDVKSRGLTRPDIERLQCYRYGGANGDESSQLDQTSCVVCLCDFELRELVRILPCRHEFHAHCVDKWLKMNRTCPLCRGDVTEPTKMDVE